MLGTRGRLAWTPGAAVMTKRGGASRAAAHRTRAAPRRATTRARRRQPDGSGNIRTDGEQAVAGGSVEPVESGPTLPCPDRDRRLRRARRYRLPPPAPRRYRCCRNRLAAAAVPEWWRAAALRGSDERRPGTRRLAWSSQRRQESRQDGHQSRALKPLATP